MARLRIATIAVMTLAFAITTAITTIAQGPSTGPAVTPTMVAKKAALAPPIGAKPAKTVGENRLTVSTANTAADEDRRWIERVDIDGGGDVEESHLIWDDEDKVLYAFSKGELACRNGGTATYGVLVAAYGKDNPRQRPAGSGFWVADLDKGECGVQAVGLWGCKFDASGSTSACGAATLDEKNDDLIVAGKTE
jgi:hypothetical protein